MDLHDHQLADHWLSRVATPEVRSALESIYSQVTAAITQRGPSCWASGHCCHFEKAGHLLYVTGLEAAYTIHALKQQVLQSPAQAISTATLSLAQFSTPTGSCPYQRDNLCTVHTIKPLGCRVYFCDQSAQQWQNDLSEQMLTQIRALHDAHAIEYRYGEWRQMLTRFDA